MNLGDVAARGAGITLAVQVGQTAVQLASVIALTRLLTPTDFGLVGMVTALVGIASIVQDFGLSMAAIRAPVVTAPQQTNLFWANTALGLACSGIVVASTPLVVAAYREPRLTPIVPALAAIFVFSGMGAQYSAMMAREFRFKELGFVSISAQVLSVAIAIVMAAAGFGFWAIVAQQVSYAALLTAGYAAAKLASIGGSSGMLFAALVFGAIVVLVGANLVVREFTGEWDRPCRAASRGRP